MLLLSIAGCGRFGFAVVGDDGEDAEPAGPGVDGSPPGPGAPDARPAPDAVLVPDEDLDGIANAVDDCPGVWNQDQYDRDADGVGDPCDPYPHDYGDVLVAAEYFDGGFGAWVPDVGAEWTAGGGTLATTGPADATSARIATSITVAHPVVSVGLAIADYGTVIDSGQIAVVLAQPNDVQRCILTGSNTIFDRLLLDGQSQVLMIPSIAAGSAAKLDFGRDDTTVGCMVNGNTIAAATGPLAGSDVDLGIEVDQVRVSIAYVLIYDRP